MRKEVCENINVYTYNLYVLATMYYYLLLINFSKISKYTHFLLSEINSAQIYKTYGLIGLAFKWGMQKIT